MKSVIKGMKKVLVSFLAVALTATTFVVSGISAKADDEVPVIESINTKYFVLKPSLEFPKSPVEVALAIKCKSQKKTNFYAIGNGTFNNTFDAATYGSYAEEYGVDGYDNQKVEKTLGSVPGFSSLNFDEKGFHYTISSVDWYVIKNESDGWHVDGMAQWNSVAIPYSVNYVLETDTDIATATLPYDANNNVNVIDNTTEDGLLAPFNTDDYYFTGWCTDTSYSTACNITSTDSIHENITVYGKVVKKVAINLQASSYETVYTGNAIGFDPVYSGTPDGYTIDFGDGNGRVSSTDMGVYATKTDISRMKVYDAANNDITAYCKINVTEGSLTITQATVWININSYTKTVGDADPVFTADIKTTPGLKMGDVIIGRETSDQGMEAAGDVVDIVALRIDNWNTNISWQVVNGTLTINPVIVEEIIPEIPSTPIVPETPEVPEIQEIIDEDVPQVPGIPEENDGDSEENLVPEKEIDEPVIELLDDEVPLASLETVEIPDEEVALAADLRDGECWIHWLILLLTILYGAYSVIRCGVRANKIKELSGSQETVREQ